MGWLSGEREHMELLYDFDLMEEGGHLRGWKLGPEQLAHTETVLGEVLAPETFRQRHGAEGWPIALLVGDGNHSLATAKECYERQKRLTPPEQWETLPARYALAELVNLYDESVTLEPIHRVLFGVEPSEVLSALVRFYPGAHYGDGEGHVLPYVHAGGEGCVTVPAPDAALEIETLQTFLNHYLHRMGGRVDYIHGAEVARRLAGRAGNLAFLLPALDKEALLPAVWRDGMLPRKTFSLGRAQDKRFYLEARKIR